jgi:hypothetical protein
MRKLQLEEPSTIFKPCVYRNVKFSVSWLDFFDTIGALSAFPPASVFTNFALFCSLFRTELSSGPIVIEKMGPQPSKPEEVQEAMPRGTSVGEETKATPQV